MPPFLVQTGSCLQLCWHVSADGWTAAEGKEYVAFISCLRNIFCQMDTSLREWKRQDEQRQPTIVTVVELSVQHNFDYVYTHNKVWVIQIHRICPLRWDVMSPAFLVTCPRPQFQILQGLWIYLSFSFHLVWWTLIYEFCFYTFKISIITQAIIFQKGVD